MMPAITNGQGAPHGVLHGPCVPNSAQLVSKENTTGMG